MAKLLIPERSAPLREYLRRHLDTAGHAVDATGELAAAQRMSVTETPELILCGSAASDDDALQLLRYVHLRWVLLLNSLDENDLGRTYFHPGSQKSFRLDEVIANYAWHSEHHYQHAFRLAQRNNWQ